MSSSYTNNAMVTAIDVGSRQSYKGRRCTIRYIGKVQDQGDKIFLGVEWDDEDGKHNGTKDGVKYFTCLSPSKTAASFVLASAKRDPQLSFLEAVRKKYASEEKLDPQPDNPSTQIEISGKVVEEVGFDKIRQQLSRLHELKNVILEDYRVGIGAQMEDNIASTCPMIEHLDLSKNLIKNFDEIIMICRSLPNLKTLKISSNRFLDLQIYDIEGPHRIVTGSGVPTDNHDDYPDAVAKVTELEMQKVLLPWHSLVRVVSFFTSLKSFDASRNCLKSIPFPIVCNTLTQLVLDHNEFTSLHDIMLLSQLPSLEVLRLKGNKIASVVNKSGLKPRGFGRKLKYIDLSSNKVSDWEFVDQLPDVFPGMTELRFSDNPVYGNISMTQGIAAAPENGHMLTVARIAQLETLNFRKIALAERADAEMFYLAQIGKEMARVPESQEVLVVAQHRRFKELCQKYEKPAIVRYTNADIDPNLLEGRLIKFKFYFIPNTQESQPDSITISKEIPKSFDIYRVKGIVGEAFDIKPWRLQLIWETGEWDPVAGYFDGEMGDDEDEDADVEEEASRENGRMIRREVELQNSTRQVGNCVDGNEATVRVQLLEAFY